MGTKIQRAVGVGAPFIYVFPKPVIEQRAPGVTDVNYPLGQVWVNNVTLPAVVSVYLGAGSWSSEATPSFTSLTVNGPTTLLGATAINNTGAATTSIATLGTGGVKIGNPTTGVLLSGPTTVSGLLIASAGINTAPVAPVAGGTPITANGRSGQVTFTGVSIAPGAFETFIINNTSITASSTIILYGMTGATIGAALTIVTVTNAAGSSTIIVTNGTGATTTVGNITFTFLLLN